MLRNRLYAILLLVFSASMVINAQTTEFTFQGKLNDGGFAVTTPRDLRFRLWDEVAGVQIGSDVVVPNVPFSNGIFTVQLDFGQLAFGGEPRWIEIAVSLPGANDYTALTPRQKLASAPYAVKSLNAASAETSETANSATTATNALQLGGVEASTFVTGLTDARNPLPGSGSYIQNQNGGRKRQATSASMAPDRQPF